MLRADRMRTLIVMRLHLKITVGLIRFRIDSGLLLDIQAVVGLVDPVVKLLLGCVVSIQSRDMNL